MFTPQFQIHSDLHLETPLTQPSYKYFSSPSHFLLHASNLLLLGDIGCIRDPALFSFLRSLLSRTPNLRIFYVLGNHEAYGITLEIAMAEMRRFEGDAIREFGDRFFFMEKRRVDVGKDVSVLGCTLWSRISEEQRVDCGRLLMDFQEYGIKGRTVERHNQDFGESLTWLNEQVRRIEETEPRRQIIILTHHSPTMDQRANDSRHKESKVRGGFVTDLQGERCWESKNVKVWAFGHTHFNCGYVDRGKLIVANQKGYCGLGGQENWKIKPVVAEEGHGGVWRVVDVEVKDGTVMGRRKMEVSGARIGDGREARKKL